jgi:hypothetical protein
MGAVLGRIDTPPAPNLFDFTKLFPEIPLFMVDLAVDDF